MVLILLLMFDGPSTIDEYIKSSNVEILQVRRVKGLITKILLHTIQKYFLLLER